MVVMEEYGFHKKVEEKTNLQGHTTNAGSTINAFIIRHKQSYIYVCVCRYIEDNGVRSNPNAHYSK